MNHRGAGSCDNTVAASEKFDSRTASIYTITVMSREARKRGSLNIIKTTVTVQGFNKNSY